MTRLGKAGPRLLALTRAAARAAAILGGGALVLVVAGPEPASAANVPVNGSGSSWASVAIDQWAANLRPHGIVVNYNPNGSAAGRTDYMANQDDFAGSDPPFRNGQDELGGTGAEHPSQGYSYIPDTAGGTAFIYHLTVRGHLIRNLRLRPSTLMGIFTGTIRNWDDPRITHDYGARLPSLPITPVIRSDGSGATFFLTRWMSHLFPSQWNAFCRRVHPGIRLPCPQTEFYPPFGSAKSENGSNNVVTYITSNYGNGSIGYDEYAYALNSHFPVVKVLNPGGYYVLPTASNVSVALTKAIINENSKSPDFLQQNLNNVYTFKDPRSYPLSSYSYLIVPRSGTQLPANFTPAKGATLSKYTDYLLCAGQSYAYTATLGYSPLPLNLVKGGLLQADKIPGHIAGPNLRTLHGCANPTFTNGKLTLLLHAPFPSPCDKLGAPLSCKVVSGHAVAAGGAGAGAGAAGGSSAAAGPSAGSSTGAGSGRQGAGNSVAAGGAGLTGASQPSAAAGVTGTTVSLAADQAARTTLGALTALGIVAALAIPPVLGMYLRRRRTQTHG